MASKKHRKKIHRLYNPVKEFKIYWFLEPDNTNLKTYEAILPDCEYGGLKSISFTNESMYGHEYNFIKYNLNAPNKDI
jgi:hypothetical protein